MVELPQITTATSIKRRIESCAESHSTLMLNYKNWYVGVTNDPATRRRAHNRKNSMESDGSQTYAWTVFNAGTVGRACEIEAYFHEKGMKDKKGKGGIKDDTVYVYVYKKYTHILDI